MIGRQKRATISVDVRLNGTSLRITPARFTVRDGDELVIDAEVSLPIVQRDDTVAGSRILRIREVLEPEVEP